MFAILKLTFTPNLIYFPCNVFSAPVRFFVVHSWISIVSKRIDKEHEKSLARFLRCSFAVAYDRGLRLRFRRRRCNLSFLSIAPPERRKIADSLPFLPAEFVAGGNWFRRTQLNLSHVGQISGIFWRRTSRCAFTRVTDCSEDSFYFAIFLMPKFKT